jgi:hypothetical protein
MPLLEKETAAGGFAGPNGALVQRPLSIWTLVDADLLRHVSSANCCRLETIYWPGMIGAHCFKKNTSGAWLHKNELCVVKMRQTVGDIRGGANGPVPPPGGGGTGRLRLQDSNPASMSM